MRVTRACRQQSCVPRGYGTYSPLCYCPSVCRVLARLPGLVVLGADGSRQQLTLAQELPSYCAAIGLAMGKEGDRIVQGMRYLYTEREDLQEVRQAHLRCGTGWSTVLLAQLCCLDGTQCLDIVLRAC